MKHSATGLVRVVMWVFLVAPWQVWVVFHPIADLRVASTLVTRPREAIPAIVEMLHHAYAVPLLSGIRPQCFSHFRRPHWARVCQDHIVTSRNPR